MGGLPLCLGGLPLSLVHLRRDSGRSKEGDREISFFLGFMPSSPRPPVLDIANNHVTEEQDSEDSTEGDTTTVRVRREHRKGGLW